ncbi:hypothetical protein E0Z10_g1293 [Xylaria hypoxylon]|uniref:1-alkyl-2-acetylglycerophosphocholine esterase n=1 Tax=Xylaria hypoxylon TaxID=37992 RepID=A0A4Z0Z6Y3_9PEZI|nr:hypothetical protein E0Z10_g1293 [Xylaria hypoxylon]
MKPGVSSARLCLTAFGLTSLQLLSSVAATAIPPPSGPYHVGKTRRTIHHYYDHDPLAPNNVSTAFLATIFYPTAQKPKVPPQPYLWNGIAEYYENHWNYTQGFLQSLTSVVQYDAPFLEGSVGQSPFPTIIFGPGGGGPPVDGNTILLSELASHGYTIIGVDHPFDQPYIQFPNGTAVVGTAWDTWLTSAHVTPIYETRVVDNRVLLERLPQIVEELNAPINTSLIGSLGFSLGGAGAVGSMYDEKIVSGLNLDGSFWGRTAANDSSSDVKKPVFLFGQEGHLGGDPSWASFPLWQTGSFRYLLVNGTTELDFFDNTFWRLLEPNPRLGGTIDPYRMINITNAYVKAFFDLTLLGRHASILDGPSGEYPEVLWYDKHGNQYPLT